MRIKINEEMAEFAVIGGAFFGGGGGGNIELGLRHAKLALELGDVVLVDIDDLPQDSTIVTVSLVGAPSSKEAFVTPSHMIKAFECMKDEIGEIAGVITSENGGYSTINGWIQAAVFEIPVVDAPADGRAHPTGVMGSLGLHNLPGYVSTQVGVGGNREKGKYVEVVAKGSVLSTSRIIREAAVEAGGLIAVVRNPVSVKYVKENAALGAIKKAIDVGKIILRYKEDPGKMAEELCSKLGGKVVGEGRVVKYWLESRGGFDIGRIIIADENRREVELVFWNEFMKLQSNGIELAKFPDLIVLLDKQTGLPLTSAEVKVGDQVIVLIVPKEKIPLGSGVLDPQALSVIESVINGGDGYAKAGD
ncbi:hypothetical protein A3L04_04870 [Thermococcus chitonophagus]|uniref:DUF917 domain-containing protein n=1 Tax=Thermococcus chitonophagus TaxID=54262 RepID=A0A160VU47_9EURY|nr:DUF917 family protein [Thermococcus chitonophagus]ASJ16453.1 hypothetical protein A3L04_04870 [Thermococcus chitonophagus]CUX78552.1 Conservative hypothetical protein probably involved in hydantoin, pyrimidine utilization [Thermococcus chitonophagus]